MKHCSEIQMERMLKGKLKRTEALLCRTHLFFCRGCRAALHKMEDDRAFVAELRKGVLVMENAHFEADALEKEQPEKADNPKYKEITNVL